MIKLEMAILPSLKASDHKQSSFIFLTASIISQSWIPQSQSQIEDPMFFWLTSYWSHTPVTAVLYHRETSAF